MDRFREVSFILFIFYDFLIIKLKKKFIEKYPQRGYKIATEMVYEYFSSLGGLIWILALIRNIKDFKYILILSIVFLLHLFFSYRIKKKNLSFFIGEDSIFKFFTILIYYVSVFTSLIIFLIGVLIFIMS